MIIPTVVDPFNPDQENPNSVDIGAGWARGSMILPQMDQSPLDNSINFNIALGRAISAAFGNSGEVISR